MSEYQPELGQLCHGNAWGEFPADQLGDGLYELSEKMAEVEQNQWQEPSPCYGNNYVGPVFEMRMYFWGECECGQEEREAEWCKTHAHATGCEYSEHEKRMAEVQGSPDIFAMPFPRCTCDHDRMFAEWMEANPHNPTCGLVRPNFKHIASGLEVRWYKYIRRGMTANRKVSEAEWKSILKECAVSLDASCFV